MPETTEEWKTYLDKLTDSRFWDYVGEHFNRLNRGIKEDAIDWDRYHRIRQVKQAEQDALHEAYWRKKLDKPKEESLRLLYQKRVNNRVY